MSTNAFTYYLLESREAAGATAHFRLAHDLPPDADASAVRCLQFRGDRDPSLPEQNLEKAALKELVHDLERKGYSVSLKPLKEGAHHDEHGTHEHAAEANGFVIRFACPCCRRHLKAKPDRIGKKLHCPACTYELVVPATSDEPKVEQKVTIAAYGVAKDFPIMAGMGPRGAIRFFHHLRCPNGKTVSETHTATETQYDLSYVNKWHAKLCPMYGSKCPQGEIGLDVYELVCGCGEHKVDKVYVDRYHVVPDRCLGVEGWTFVDSTPNGKTLSAGESDS